MADDDVRGAEVYSIRLRKSAARGGPKSRSGLSSLGYYAKLAGVLKVLALEALRYYTKYACKQTDSVARRAWQVLSEAVRRASRRWKMEET